MMLRKFVALGATLFLTAAWVLAQEPSGSGDAVSLADLARQQRARRMKVMQERSVRIWTNDNMPRRPASEGPTASVGMSAVPAQPATEASETSTPSPLPGQGTSADAATGTEPSSSEGVHDEEYYRERMAELRARLNMHQRQLSVLQQKQALGQTQYYADPNKTLQQEYSRSDINDRNQEIAKKQQEIAADEQAIQELRDQLRREGHPAGWLR